MKHDNHYTQIWHKSHFDLRDSIIILLSPRSRVWCTDTDSHIVCVSASHCVEYSKGPYTLTTHETDKIF